MWLVARNIDPDRSADCHASGSVPTAAYLVREGKIGATMCGHHLAKNADAITAGGWDIVHVQRTAGAGVGTEATPNHYAVGG